MREMPTHMGATGNDPGAEGLPEVQESLLEHPRRNPKVKKHN